MLDSDLANLFECETGHLNRARLRNKKIFSEDFVFHISKEEYTNLKCQIGISNIDLRKISRNLPYVCTKQGAANVCLVSYGLCYLLNSNCFTIISRFFLL